MENVSTEFATLASYLRQERSRHPEELQDLEDLVTAIATAVKAVSSLVSEAGYRNLYGYTGVKNATGDNEHKLDVIANNIFISAVASSLAACMIVSEETKDVIHITAEKRGKFLVTFDPLDGSANIECLGSIGSIFAIYRLDKEIAGHETSDKDALVKGRNIVAAGYSLYGSATMLVLSLGREVNGFHLNQSIGEFVLTDADIKIKDRGSIYSVNEAYEKCWHKGITEFVRKKKYADDGSSGYSARYFGSLVGDAHRTLMYGGIFMYHAKGNDPKAGLRLLYECNPMAFIFAKAGGLATDGSRPLLDLQPTTIHCRVPIFIGSKIDVQEVMELISNSD